MTLTSLSQASAEKLYSCKKRNGFVYSSFYWAEIEKLDSGELLFRYGNGIDTQMMEVLFMSGLEQKSPTEYAWSSDDFQLKVKLKSGLLDFKVVNAGKSYGKSGFRCE